MEYIFYMFIHITHKHGDDSVTEGMVYNFYLYVIVLSDSDSFGEPMFHKPSLSLFDCLFLSGVQSIPSQLVGLWHGICNIHVVNQIFIS